MTGSDTETWDDAGERVVRCQSMGEKGDGMGDTGDGGIVLLKAKMRDENDRSCHGCYAP